MSSYAESLDEAGEESLLFDLIFTIIPNQNQQSRPLSDNFKIRLTLSSLGAKVDMVVNFFFFAKLF